MALQHGEHRFGVFIRRGLEVRPVRLSQRGQVDHADPQHVPVEFAPVDRVGDLVDVAVGIAPEQRPVLFAGEVIIRQSRHHRHEIPLGVDHHRLAVFVRMRHGPADQVALVQDRKTLDFTPELVRVGTTVQTVAAQRIAAQIVIDLPDLAPIFVPLPVLWPLQSFPNLLAY